MLSLLRVQFAVSLLALFTGAQQIAVAQAPRHEQELTLGWKSYEQKDLEQALAHVDIVLREFRRQAARDQQALIEKKVEVPIGAVAAAQKQAIQANGVLNDVSAAYYLRGVCLDRLGRTAAAAASLAEATKLPDGRCWDTRGFFWSPAEAAQLYLSHPELVDKAPHEAFTALAWAAFNDGANEAAILQAQKCVDQFSSTAEDMQRELTKQRAVIGNGVVSNEMRDEIFKNGVLNDVATCYFVIGEAAVKINDKRTAHVAYRKATQLKYGRCFDPSGPWFWSPAEVSGDRLLDLR